MKYLPLLPIAVFCVALHAQTSATGTANASETAGTSISRTTTAQQAASAVQTANVSAELTKKIDTKNAQVGDEVTAKTISAATLADGTKLPKGTKLLGKVTDTHARSNADQTSHLAFRFDRGVLHDGREIPVHAVLTSITGVAASTQAADDMAMSSPIGGGMAGGSVQSAGGARSSGVLGGVGRTAGGVANTAGGAVGGATNTVSDVGGVVRSNADSVVNGMNATGNVAGDVGSTARLERAPVTNLPGITLSSAASSSSSASLDSANRNISLASGTQMSLNIAAAQQ